MIDAFAVELSPHRRNLLLQFGALAVAEAALLQPRLQPGNFGPYIGAAALRVADLRSDVLAADPRLGQHAFGLFDAGKRIAPELARDGGVELEQQLRLDLILADEPIGHAGDPATRDPERLARRGMLFLHLGDAIVVETESIGIVEGDAGSCGDRDIGAARCIGGGFGHRRRFARHRLVGPLLRAADQDERHRARQELGFHEDSPNMRLVGRR